MCRAPSRPVSAADDGTACVRYINAPTYGYVPPAMPDATSPTSRAVFVRDAVDGLLLVATERSAAAAVVAALPAALDDAGELRLGAIGEQRQRKMCALPVMKAVTAASSS